MAQLICGFIGLGLIGGSIAKALKQADPTIRIIAYDTNSKTLDAALAQHTADVVTPVIDASFQDCNFIFLCAPVAYNNQNLEAIKPWISPSCILTDVGSVKMDIHRHISLAGLDCYFIGGHPMAGSERTGFQNSKAILLENAYYILTPSSGVSQVKLDAYRDLVKLMGAIPLELTYEQHDYATAAVSHLPHLIAASLVNLVKDSDSEDGIMKLIAAGGFRDITRIASSSGTMWNQICLTNKENILLLLDKYIRSLQETKQILESDNGERLYHFFDSARLYRDSITNTSRGPLPTSFVLTVDIADRAGALASIATMLAQHDISIKNIGITHNREYEEGTLRIEFYNKNAVRLAKELLLSEGYSIYDYVDL